MATKKRITRLDVEEAYNRGVCVGKQTAQIELVDSLSVERQRAIANLLAGAAKLVEEQGKFASRIGYMLDKLNEVNK